MLKLFFKNSFFFFIVQVVSYVVSFFMLPLYTAHLSKADYGALEMLGIIHLIVLAAGSLQIQQGIARSLPDHTFNDPVLKKALISTGFIFSVGAFMVCTGFGYIFHRRMCLWVVGDLQYLTAYDLALLNVLLAGIANYLQVLKVYQMEGKKSAIASICSVFVSIPLTIFLVIKAKWGIAGVMTANVAGQVVVILLLFKENLPQLAFKIDRKLLGSMLRFSTPLVFSSLAYLSWNFVDRIMMKHFLSLSDLGLFSVGTKFNVPFTAMLSIFETSLFPIVINQYHKRQMPAKIEKLASLLILITVLLWLGVCIFARQILGIMVSRPFQPAWEITGIAIGALIFTRVGFLAPGMAIAKKVKYFIYLIIITSIVNTVLNFVLIPWVGIIGAPLATFISGGVYLFLIFRKSQKLYVIPYRFLNLFTVLALVIASIVAVHFGERYFAGRIWIIAKTISFFILSFIIYKLLITNSFQMLIARLLKKTRSRFSRKPKAAMLPG